MKVIRPTTVTEAMLTSDVPLEAQWNSGTTYALGDVVRGSGDKQFRLFESLQASNTNHALTDAAWWLETGPCNRWAMFDDLHATETTQADEIEVEFNDAGRNDSIALLRLSAAEAHIVVDDPIDGIVYDETYNLTSTSGINDWASYFRERIERVSELVVTDLPPYDDPTITVTLSAAGEDVSCGVCVIGYAKKIGRTQYGAQLGLLDFSLKERDARGNFIIQEGAYSDEGSFRIEVDNAYVDRLKLLLKDYRARPVVWVGSDQYASTVFFGIYRSFNIEIAQPEVSLCTLELESLT